MSDEVMILYQREICPDCERKTTKNVTRWPEYKIASDSSCVHRSALRHVDSVLDSVRETGGHDVGLITP